MGTLGSAVLLVSLVAACARPGNTPPQAPVPGNTTVQVTISGAATGQATMQVSAFIEQVSPSARPCLPNSMLARLPDGEIPVGPSGPVAPSPCRR
ncbi:hypothetical protein AB0M54_31525 [Actinoplanes sp. NPDC051470]|uniref:hypothetical protein n=1 Tax=unclassified Actinoplanes TaxID=2626549 RepID=UPI00341E767D